MHTFSTTTLLLPLLPAAVLIASLALGDTDTTIPSPAAAASAITTPQGAALDLTSASCGKCHKTIYEQWKGSRHAHAWTNQPYKDWMAAKKKPESCHKCHIPQSVLGVAPKQPKPREDRLEEGVGCASCHVQDGKVHGPHGTPCDAHENVKSPLYAASTVDLCQSCHRVTPKPVISLGKDFERSGLAEEGKNCRSCHMPEFEGHSAFDEVTGKPVGEKRKLKSHAFVGASHEEMTAKAFKLLIAPAEGGYELKITNECGHRLPGLACRKYKMRFALVDSKGVELVGTDHEMTSKKSLKLGATIDKTLAHAEGAVSARVRFTHFFQPKPKGPWEDRGQVLELIGLLPKD